MTDAGPAWQPIPVTVIGGYLGAGKTTLVNHLLRTASGRRIAVLVNEFGSLPIDEDLIEARDDTMINIAGGCVCCSYGSDMMAALMDLQDLDPAPDHVLLEASGVALPGAVAQSVELLADCRLDGTVVLADAETVRARAVDTYLSDTITRQLEAADIVLLNKADIVTPDTLAAVREWLSTMAPEAPAITTTQAAVGGDVVFGVASESLIAGPASPPSAGHRPRHDHHHDHHHHEDPDIGHQSLSLELRFPVDAEALARRLADRRLDLVRAKGVVWTADGPAATVQVVGRRWRVDPAPRGYNGQGRLVCIRVGGAVDAAAVDALLEDVSVSPSGP